MTRVGSRRHRKKVVVVAAAAAAAAVVSSTKTTSKIYVTTTQICIKTNIKLCFFFRPYHLLLVTYHKKFRHVKVKWIPNWVEEKSYLYVFMFPTAKLICQKSR
jgi:hypothetical protein